MAQAIILISRIAKAYLFRSSIGRAEFVITVLAAMLLVPLFVARLKDVRWSPLFALLVIAPTVPLLVGQFSSSDDFLGASMSSGSIVYTGLSNLLGLCLLLFTIVLAVMPTR